MSDIIHSTTDIIRENNFQDVITLVKGRLEDLQGKKFVYWSLRGWDIFCSMKEYWTVIAARDRYLSLVKMKFSSGFDHL